MYLCCWLSECTWRGQIKWQHETRTSLSLLPNRLNYCHCSVTLYGSAYQYTVQYHRCIPNVCIFNPFGPISMCTFNPFIEELLRNHQVSPFWADDLLISEQFNQSEFLSVRLFLLNPFMFRTEQFCTSGWLRFFFNVFLSNYLLILWRPLS